MGSDEIITWIYFTKLSYVFTPYYILQEVSKMHGKIRNIQQKLINCSFYGSATFI